MNCLRFILALLCIRSAVHGVRISIGAPKFTAGDTPEKYFSAEWSRSEAKCMNKCENDARCISCEFDGDASSNMNCRCLYMTRSKQKWVPKKDPSPEALAVAVKDVGEESCEEVRRSKACENICNTRKRCTHYRVFEKYGKKVCCALSMPKPKKSRPPTRVKNEAPDRNAPGTQKPSRTKKNPTKNRGAALICQKGSEDFADAEAPDDCKEDFLHVGIEGRNRLNSFGLRYCFDTDTKISWYVQFMMRKDQTRTGYRRNGLLFKLNPRLGVCDQQAPSWYSCPHVWRGKGKQGGTPNWCDWYRQKKFDVAKTCIDHPVQPASVCNKMVFSGKQCGCPELSGKVGGGTCSVNEETCMSYSGYENAVCKGWGEDSDYDRGHMAASSDVFDDQEVAEVCDKVDSKVANVWDDPYEAGFNKSQWHHGDYAKCAWTASFLMTNVVPQGSLLNQICWRDIENALKQYSEGKRDLFVVVGNSRQGMMRGQKTPLDDGYDPKSPDMVLIPKFIWKAACTTTKPTQCTAWITANRNLPVPEGCRTPLTLRQLKEALRLLDELKHGDWIPGMKGWDSDTLLPDLEIKCENQYRPEFCKIDGGKDWPETKEDQSLQALDDTVEPPSPIQLTCEDGDDCTDFCRCCDSSFLKFLKEVTAE